MCFQVLLYNEIPVRFNYISWSWIWLAIKVCDYMYKYKWAAM